ncbi:Methyltransferase domain protein [compost metagenome]
MTNNHPKELTGYCPICASPTVFIAHSDWYRDSLTCPTCPGGSVPRERAVALMLEELRPNWRELKIHECSPSPTGISQKLSRECRQYTPTQYFPNEPTGKTVRQFRNENLQSQTFDDETFDIFISLDVFEHLNDPKAALKEIARTLKKDGLFIMTFPIRKHLTAPISPRVITHEDGSLTHLCEPEIHGNPVSNEGSLVTFDYGYDIHNLFSEWGGLDIRVSRFSDRRHGIIGEYTEVLVGRRNAEQIR